MRALLTMGLVATLAAGAVVAQGPPQGPAAVPTAVKVGDMAPDFSLQGTDGKMHKLDVKARQGGMKVRARKEYHAAK